MGEVKPTTPRIEEDLPDLSKMQVFMRLGVSIARMLAAVGPAVTTIPWGGGGGGAAGQHCTIYPLKTRQHPPNMPIETESRK